MVKMIKSIYINVYKRLGHHDIGFIDRNKENRNREMECQCWKKVAILILLLNEGEKE